MKTRILLIAALALTACSPQGDKTPESASATVSEAAPVIVSSAAPASSAASVAELPAAFVGKWDAPHKPCSTDYSEMQLTITATEMHFYESGGQIRSVKINNPTDVVAQVSMSGEGDSWEDTMHMVLSDDGRTLTINEGKTGVRTRCA